jgi:flagellar protein FlaG
MLIQNTASVVVSPAPPRLPSNGGASGVAGQTGSERIVANESAVARSPTPSQLNSEVSKINAALQNANKNLELSISVDKATNKQVVKLMDKTTGDTLLQYPSEAVLAIAKGIDEFQNGILLRQQA